MGLALDTVAFTAANPGTTYTAATAATGDSFVVRNFNPATTAILERIVRGGAASGAVRILSPMLHDNVRGLTFISAESPAHFLMPRGTGQQLRAQDTLVVQLTGGTNETDLGALSIYYSDLIGAAARLHSWADIKPLIKHIKPVEVDVTTSSTIGAWLDTVVTTTENLLQANTDYAVLGYNSDVAVDLVGVKGGETANLRVCGPGPAITEDTTSFYVEWSEREGTPHIPVLNSANVGSIYVSTLHHTASLAVKVQLILAELTSNLPN